MKNLFLLLAFLLVLPINISAQSFLDKVLKGVEKTNKILDETDKMLGSDGSSQSSSRRRKVSGFQIISPHPDIEIQFKRCVISGSTAILDLVITNYGKDANIQLGGSSNKVFDDLGNQYPETQVSIAESGMYGWKEALFPTDVPLKFRLQIYDISSQATMFKRINLNIYSRSISFGDPIFLYNVPITRKDNSVKIVSEEQEITSTQETFPVQTSSGSLESGKEVNEDFAAFEEKFVANPRFQMLRIKFDNLGYNGEGEKWTQENWSIFKNKPSSLQESGEYKYEQKLSADQCVQRIWIPDSEFTLEYTYSKINGKWYLVKAFERF